MSLIEQTVGNIEDLWAAFDKLKRQVGVIDRTQQREKARLDQTAALAGEASYGPLSNGPTSIFVRIEAYLASGYWSARRMRQEAASWVLDDEDEELYHVRTTPAASGIFVGARGWVQHTSNEPSLIEEDGGAMRGIYSTQLGDWAGFEAVVGSGGVGSVGSKVAYPWSQVGVPAGDAYTNATEFNETPLGLAILATQAGWETGVTITRVELDPNTPCRVWYSAVESAFMMMQISEPQNDECVT